MNQQTALNTLIQAARIANRRGAFELDESANIAAAIDAFREPQPEPEQKDKKTMHNPYLNQELESKRDFMKSGGSSEE
jgi:hypothetical protein